ncbi:hypothetical protein HY793_00500 [Candidatus Desantisbacteria bacterium]|nr:hypothetical protein [Candidatus Desantisbacteria bacterium]
MPQRAPTPLSVGASLAVARVFLRRKQEGRRIENIPNIGMVQKRPI